MGMSKREDAMYMSQIRILPPEYLVTNLAHLIRNPFVPIK
jgi:hypothetical protein